MLVAATLVGVPAVLLASASPASAHARVVRTEPAAQAVAPTSPGQVVVVFDEAVDASLGVLTVRGPDGRPAQRGAAVRGADDRSVVVQLVADPPTGSYVVRYRMVSDDGHPVSGGFGFSIGRPSTPSGPAGPAADDGPATVDPVVQGLLSSGRYVGFLGLVVLGGAAVMAVAFRRERLDLRRPRAWAVAGGLLAAAGTLAALVAQGPYETGRSLGRLDRQLLLAVAGSTVGAAQVVRLVLLLVLVPVAARLLGPGVPGAGGRSRRDGLLIAAGAVGVLFTWPFSGHAGAEPLWPLAVAAGAVHLAATAVWVGGLLVLARGLLPAADPAELAAVLPVWSRRVAVVMAALVGSGVVQALLTVDSPALLAGTGYGRLLIAKSLAVAVVLALASRARRLVPLAVARGTASGGVTSTAVARPGGTATATATATRTVTVAAGSPPVPAGTDVRPLRTLVRVELAIAAVVLALATALVQTPPARATASPALASLASLASPAEQEQEPDPAVGHHAATSYSGFIRTPSLTVAVDVLPAVVGVNTVAITALDRSGAPVEVTAWTATAALPGRDVPDVPLGLRPFALGVAAGSPTLPAPGDWVFSITIRTGAGAPVTLTHTVPIGPAPSAGPAPQP